MTNRWLAAGTLAASLLMGCRSTPPRWSSASAIASAPDPDQWDRAVCYVGEYPADLDARAHARARYEDLQARQNGSANPFAAAGLESKRNAFDARCAAWRSARNEIWASAAHGLSQK